MVRVIERQTIDEAANLLLRAAPAGSRVILFGSYARGGADPESDVDFLVVEPEVKDQIAEEVRLRKALDRVDFAVDVLVMSRGTFEYWKDTPNTLAYEVVREGKAYEPLA